MTTKTVIRRAAKLIRQKGWFAIGPEGLIGQPAGAGGVCLYTALGDACGGATPTYAEVEARFATYDLIEAEIGMSMIEWNDRQTSAEPVLALLDRLGA